MQPLAGRHFGLHRASAGADVVRRVGTLGTVPILTMLSHTHNYLTSLLLVLVALVIVSGYTSINAVVKAELFPAAVRALGVGLPYAMAVSIFGGTAPYAALWCKSHGIEPAFY